MTQSIDYIVIGGGLGGCVVATRLAEHDSTLTVMVVEAGSNVSKHPLTSEPLASFQAHYSPLDWAYTTKPQVHLDNRACYNSAGKALGGGTAVNYGTWTRGPREDYDDWASVVGDKRWSYEGMLPYFKKTESCQDEPTKEAAEQHGFDGPISNIRISQSSEKRIYPLREPLLQAWKSIGVEYNEDGNAGHPQGVAETRENWKNGKRQIASEAYGLHRLSNIIVKTDTLVRRVLIEDTTHGKKAVGIELDNGEQIKAKKEIIISCGAYRTPQLLLLSGIGPTDELERHGITQHKDLPVGKKFYDHLSLSQFWKLKHPEQGLAIGTPLWNDPAYGLGVPNDFLITTSVPYQSLESALEKDGDTQSHSLLKPGRCHLETLFAYAPAGAQIQNTPVPFDGTHITSAVLGMLPTSRGSITLASSNPSDAPVIDPNYYATEFDRVLFRTGIRKVIQLMLGTSEGQSFVASEMPPPGFEPLGLDASDAEIDARVRRAANTFYHPAGSAAMGSVVDTDLKVYGIGSLRVVDASILPVAICAHYQVPVYALAEQAADIIKNAG